MGYSAGSTIRLLQQLLPPIKINGAPTVEELNFRFRRTVWFVGFGMPLAGIAFAWSAHAILLNLNRYLATLEGPAAFRILPVPVIWDFLPFFGAVCLAWELTMRVWTLFDSREKIELYSYWADLRSGFQCTKAFRWMALIVVLPIGIATILELPVHTTFHDSEMHIRGYGSLSSSRYAYTDVKRLMAIDGYLDRSGRFGPNAQIVLVFSDGRRWSSADHQDPGNNINPELLHYLEEKTLLPVEHKRTEGDTSKPG